MLFTIQEETMRIDITTSLHDVVAFTLMNSMLVWTGVLCVHECNKKFLDDGQILGLLAASLWLSILYSFFCCLKVILREILKTLDPH